MSDTPGIPALINAKSGTADAARTAITANAAFELHEVDPDQIAEQVRTLASNAARILVAGGDGTIATAAGELLGLPTELAILPGGTLNHFARDMGLPEDATEALALAATGSSRTEDVATVNGRAFLNTSSVGAYVHFVKVREYLERRFGYRVASFFAALRVMVQFRSIAVEMEVDGRRRIYRTPLVFIGVGERELQLPSLGNRVKSGQRGLHVLVVRGRTRARLLATGLSAVARGTKATSRSLEMDSFIVDRVTLTQNRRSSTVAVDGELVRLDTPLEYRIERDALTVVCPPERPASNA